MLGIIFPLPLFTPFDSFTVLSVGLATFTFFWGITGTRYMDEKYLLAGAILVVTPVLSLINSFGAVYGTIRPPDGFEVTEKASDSTITNVAESD